MRARLFSMRGSRPQACGSVVLVCFLQPDAANIQCVVQTVLGGLAGNTSFRRLGLVGGEKLQMNLIGYLHIAALFCGKDLQVKHIRVGHTAVIQLVVLADEGLAFMKCTVIRV